MRIFALFFLLLIAPGELWAMDCPPKPSPDDFVLPGPGGICFAFRAVPVGEGETPYVQKRFTMGDQEEGYKGYPTAVTVGGAFSRPNASGISTWLYYIGKYEVTEGQYYAVTGLPRGADPKLLDSPYPVTDISYSEALDFTNKLNTWLFSNEPMALPRRGESLGFVRLPTEAEWEFAARGGLSVRPELFAAYHPYEDNLEKYEWFFGPKSSHGKVRPTGGLAPNPLGVHDMLGNVSEMVQTPYQLEYYQGTAGGVTVKGGNFTTNENKIRAAMRVEQPLYKLDAQRGMRTNSNKTTGFRLVIGATVLSDREIINSLQDGWDEYHEAASDLPARLSTAPVEKRAGVSIDEARSALQQVRATLKAANAPASVFQTLGSVEAGMDKATEMRKLADEDATRRFVELGALSGFDAGREFFKLGVADEMLRQRADNPAMVERISRRRRGIEDNIKNRLNAYYICMEALMNVREEIVEKELDKLQIRLKDMNFSELGVAVDLLRKHGRLFRKEKKGNLEEWRKDFAAIPRECFMDKGSE